MAIRYFCNMSGRRDAVKNTADLNGIDFIEVSDNQLELTIKFLKPLPGETNGVPAGPVLKEENFVIEGGVRVTGITCKVQSTVGDTLTLKVSTPGDFSTYTLRVVDSVTGGVLRGFDPIMGNVDFSVTVGCPNPFDCKSVSECGEEASDTVDINYLARDFPTFRRLLMDQMARQLPDWSEPNGAAAITASIETFAYVFDRLSYMQDAVATEAYLETARLRPSVRRHARLLDYFVSEGCNARAWICFEATDVDGDGAPLTAPTKVVAGARILALGENSPTTIAEGEASKISPEPLAFELMEDITLRKEFNSIDFYTWSEEDCCLPKGATSATLVAGTVELTEGKTIILEEIDDPETGIPDPSHRWAVKLTKIEELTDPVNQQKVVNVEWHPNDALPFALRLSKGERVTAVARGNVALADHGLTFVGQEPLPTKVPKASAYRPVLPRSDITFANAFNNSAKSAAEAAATDPATARCTAVANNHEQGDWTATADLLDSDGFVLAYVAEPGDDRRLTLRFGDDIYGSKPAADTTFSVVFRAGNGRQGNVGCERLTTLVSSQAFVSRVWNPMPASGGVDPESLEEVRRYAPQAFRTQERAVTQADYAEVALRFRVDGKKVLQKAVAEFRWTGSWLTVNLTVDRLDGKPVADDDVGNKLLAHMDNYRMAGVDIEIRDAIFVPLDLGLRICVKSGYFRSKVQQEALSLLSSRILTNGTKGLFHPDNYTFAQHVYISQIIGPIEALDGVDSVTVTKLQRWGGEALAELADGFLRIGPTEIARLDNDPSIAENGRIEIEMGGGL